MKNLPIETGELRIAMAESIANTFFPEILERFHQLYPKIKVTLYTAGTDSLFHKLRHNEADLVYTLDKRIYSSEIVTVMEKKEEIFFVASPKHRLAGRNCLIEDLLGEDFLLTEKDMSYRRHLEEYLASKSLEINPFLELGNVEILKSLVEKNAGISFLPEFTIKRQLEEQRLVKINIPEVFKVWRQLIYHKHKWVTASMKVMIDLIRDYEYDAIMEVAYEALEYNDTVFINAPFTREVRQPEYMENLRQQLLKRGAELVVVWVKCDVEVCRQRMIQRDSDRDTWKLEHWDEYVKKLDFSIPQGIKNLFEFDNSSDNSFKESLKNAVDYFNNL